MPTYNISSGSKDLVLYKNKQFNMYLKANQTHSITLSEAEEFRRLIKRNNVDVRHMNALKSAFLSTDLDRTGIIDK